MHMLHETLEAFCEPENMSTITVVSNMRKKHKLCTCRFLRAKTSTEKSIFLVIVRLRMRRYQVKLEEERMNTSASSARLWKHKHGRIFPWFWFEGMQK